MKIKDVSNEKPKKINIEEIRVSKDLCSNMITLKLNKTVHTDEFSNSDYAQCKELENVLRDYLEYKESINNCNPENIEALKYVINELNNENWNQQQINNFHFEIEEFNKMKGESIEYPQSLYQSNKKSLKGKRLHMTTNKKEKETISKKTKRIHKVRYKANIFKTPELTYQTSKTKNLKRKHDYEQSIYNEINHHIQNHQYMNSNIKIEKKFLKKDCIDIFGKITDQHDKILKNNKILNLTNNISNHSIR